MPKTAMNKNNCFVLWQYDIGVSRKIPTMNPKPKTRTMEKRSN
nr:MAG TPA: hypothetical protein [Caudoviricetes sp.]